MGVPSVILQPPVFPDATANSNAESVISLNFARLVGGKNALIVPSKRCEQRKSHINLFP